MYSKVKLKTECKDSVWFNYFSNSDYLLGSFWLPVPIFHPYSNSVVYVWIFSLWGMMKIPNGKMAAIEYVCPSYKVNTAHSRLAYNTVFITLMTPQRVHESMHMDVV